MMQKRMSLMQQACAEKQDFSGMIRRTALIN